MQEKASKTYIAPKAELYHLTQPLNLLTSLSLYGDINDYEEGGLYEGEFSDPLE